MASITVTRPAVADLLLAAADRIEANPILAPTDKVSAGFPRIILTMTVRTALAALREQVAETERSEYGSGLTADYYSRRNQDGAAYRDASRYAAATSLRATAARQALREAEIAAEQNILAALDTVGPIATGTTRGDLVDLLRLAAVVVTS